MATLSELQEVADKQQALVDTLYDAIGRLQALAREDGRHTSSVELTWDAWREAQRSLDRVRIAIYSKTKEIKP
jgi:hypothetical protein